MSRSSWCEGRIRNESIRKNLGGKFFTLDIVPLHSSKAKIKTLPRAICVQKRREKKRRRRRIEGPPLRPQSEKRGSQRKEKISISISRMYYTKAFYSAFKQMTQFNRENSVRALKIFLLASSAVQMQQQWKVTFSNASYRAIAFIEKYYFRLHSGW